MHSTVSIVKASHQPTGLKPSLYALVDAAMCFVRKEAALEAVSLFCKPAHQKLFLAGHEMTHCPS